MNYKIIKCCYKCEKRTIEPINCHEICEEYISQKEQLNNLIRNKQFQEAKSRDIKELKRVKNEKIRMRRK